MIDFKSWLIENIFSIVTSILGGGSLLGWIQERKKRKIEENQLTADALKSMQEAYDTFTQDSLGRYNILKEEIDSLKIKLINVSSQLQTEKDYNQKLLLDYRQLEIDLALCQGTKE